MSNENANRKGVDTAADAVRKYLVYLEDPSALVNDSTVQKLSERLKSTTAPLDRLLIASELYAAESVDQEALAAAFIRHAAGYAKREGIAPEAFLRLGVSEDVVRSAGLLAPAAKKSAPAAKRGKERSPRTGREVVVACVPRRAFTYRDLEELSGASVLTVRRVVEELINSGAISDIGPDPEYTGRGRAPRRFQPTNSSTTGMKGSTAKGSTRPATKRGSSDQVKSATKRPAKTAAKRPVKGAAKKR